MCVVSGPMREKKQHKSQKPYHVGFCLGRYMKQWLLFFLRQDKTRKERMINQIYGTPQQIVDRQLYIQIHECDE